MEKMKKNKYKESTDMVVNKILKSIKVANFINILPTSNVYMKLLTVIILFIFMITILYIGIRVLYVLFSAPFALYFIIGMICLAVYLMFKIEDQNSLLINKERDE